MRTYLLLILLPLIGTSQTGPGGVGSSTNNKLWLDANRGITVSGTSVTAWADQSGNGFVATPTAVISRPAYVSNSANGYPSIDFDGTDDQFWIDHNAAFNLVGWHFFIVPMKDNSKNYNAWLTKGNDGQENFEMLSYNTDNVHTPIYFTDASRSAPSTGNSIITTTANIIEYTYTTSLGRDVYKDNNNIYTDNDSKTPATNNFSVYIGNEKNIAGRNIDGDLCEVIMYNAPLNTAQRIIVNNYLAAKYNCTLSANDYYVQDNSTNGNYDHDVAGIGQESTGSQTNSKGSGIVTILNPSGLGNGEYYLWGHDNGPLGSYTATPDVPTTEGVQRRLLRVWRGSEVGTITSFDVRFDLTGLGSVTASDLRLLIDTDNDGVFADETAAGGGVISGATFVSGSTYQFAGVTGMNNNLRFTIGTYSVASTPLPIELLDFNAICIDKTVKLNWRTASEKNSENFIVERSQNAIDFEPALSVKASGNSNTLMEYTETDFNPNSGLTYYRLKMVDLDGTFKYSTIVPVNYRISKNGMQIYPNPSNGEFKIDLAGFQNNNVLVVVRDMAGKELYSKVALAQEGENLIVIDSENKLSPGTYVVVASSNNDYFSQKIIVR